MKTITLVTSDDWEGLYLDDKLVCENHRISAIELLQTLQHHGNIKSVWVFEAVPQELPVDLEEVIVRDIYDCRVTLKEFWEQ